MRLNGWQRLFVLISVFYLGLVISLFVSINSFPTRNYYYKQWSLTLASYLTPAEKNEYESFNYSLQPSPEQLIPIFEDILNKNQVSPVPQGLRPVTDPAILAQLNASLPQQQSQKGQRNPLANVPTEVLRAWANELCERSGSYNCAVDLRIKYTYLLNNIFYMQAKYMFIFFVIWFLPLLVLYVFGWLCGWVREGFKDVHE
jgi:hypothetical protein